MERSKPTTVAIHATPPSLLPVTPIICPLPVPGDRALGTPLYLSMTILTEAFGIPPPTFRDRYFSLHTASPVRGLLIAIRRLADLRTIHPGGYGHLPFTFEWPLTRMAYHLAAGQIPFRPLSEYVRLVHRKPSEAMCHPARARSFTLPRGGGVYVGIYLGCYPVLGTYSGVLRNPMSCGVGGSCTSIVGIQTQRPSIPTVKGWMMFR